MRLGIHRKGEEAENERDPVKQELSHAEHRTAAELLIRPTTLSEYLDLCLTHLFQAIAVKADLTLSTQGDGVPNNSAWLGLRETYSLSNPRVFPHLAYLNTCGQDIAVRLLASKPGVAYLQRLSVENPVSKILHHLHTLPHLREGFHLDSTGVAFDNQPNALSDRAEEVIEKMAGLTLRRPLTPRASPHIGLPLSSNTRPPTRSLLTSFAWPSPDRDPILVDDVISCASTPHKDDASYLQHKAETRVAQLVTQAFSYMIKARTCVGYITTGQAWVFVHISLDDPPTVCHRLAEPEGDVAQSCPNQKAMGQVVAFSLLALESPSPHQAWLARAKTLPKWILDLMAVLDKVPATVEKWTPDHKGIRHRLNGEKLLFPPCKQLQSTRDEYCDPLGRQGARGALFRVTLASYGYTMVAKGTVPVFADKLQRERRVYHQLRPLQGVCVPVCLGNIDLVYPYYYDVKAHIVHMMFKSWAGPCLGWDGIPAGLNVDHLKGGISDLGQRHAPRWSVASGSRSA
ncbi:MAG: hypothetical protein M1839_004309 [Geoglossum umbratile]|nr:MAG: hypothetical protein M1839_004309 [Geoglossum umbratile]